MHPAAAEQLVASHFTHRSELFQGFSLNEELWPLGPACIHQYANPPSIRIARASARCIDLISVGGFSLEISCVLCVQLSPGHSTHRISLQD